VLLQIQSTLGTANLLPTIHNNMTEEEGAGEKDYFSDKDYFSKIN
jgi:hypothetical protein